MHMEDRWFTVIYFSQGRIRTFHVITPTKALARRWCSVLLGLRGYQRELETPDTSTPEDSVLVTLWSQVVKQRGNDRDVKFADVEGLCRQLHVRDTSPAISELYELVRRENGDRFNSFDFQQLVRALKVRPEVRQIYGRVAGDRSMGFESFHWFLREVQGHVDMSVDAAREIFHAYYDKSVGYVTHAGFAKFLASDDNPVVLDRRLDYSRPLSEYFISSSHNTYLLSGQFTGESSIEGYIDALHRGCRCIEIDCWDGSDGPVVWHGHSLTTKVSFLDVIRSIRDYAFVSSAYPLIISLDVHCGAEQQDEIALLTRRVFGAALVTQPLSHGELPSPQELMFRVLVKTKYPSTNESTDFARAATYGNQNDSSPSSEAAVMTPAGSTSTTADSSSFERWEKTSATDSADSVQSFGSRASFGRIKSNGKPLVRFSIAQSLLELAVYCKTIKFRNFGLPESKKFDHVFSFSERRLNRLCKADGQQITKHNRRFLMRVYPSGFRINSSNFDPLNFWAHGVQMVALNWQTRDLSMHLNEALFAPGGNSGYLLKPTSLRQKQHHIGHKEPRHVSLSIKLVSGQHLARPRIVTESGEQESGRYSVTIDIVDLGKAAHSWTSPAVANGDWGPAWDGDAASVKFVFTTRSRTLCFVRFRLFCDAFEVATYTMRLNALQRGFRHIPLKDLRGNDYVCSTLLAHFSLSL